MRTGPFSWTVSSRTTARRCQTNNEQAQPPQKSSPFHKLIQDHPSDILIPFVHSQRRLPHVAHTERDDTTAIPHHDLTTADVLLGRGGLASNYEGNLWFRELVSKYRNAYTEAPKFQKSQLARNLCHYIRLSGGRFLEQQPPPPQQAPVDDNNADNSICWFECGDPRALAKCSQALREIARNTVFVPPRPVTMTTTMDPRRTGVTTALQNHKNESTGRHKRRRPQQAAAGAAAATGGGEDARTLQQTGTNREGEASLLLSISE